MAQTLGEVFSDFSFTSLSNLSVGSEGDGTIEASAESRFVALVNRSLKRLYSKFIILEKEFEMRLMTTRTLYPLQKIYADQDVTVGDKFIKDTVANTFVEDIIRILYILDADGVERPLNDLEDETSIYTPSNNILQIPVPLEDEALFVMYQARHETLGVGDMDQLVYLPEPLYEALEAHVAYQVYSAMNGPEHAAKSQEHYARYETICQNVINLDLVKSSFGQSNIKLELRGYK